ncbi:MAG: cell envelope integrity protein CreD [Bacteroidetes bacterium]|nr:MAG: cell envelope integrity protein CreD [Bacteroidota bacterium]REK07563.1 MAG: cell envelope integrity protein CreD [Bacteroidota bacterium]REK37004.1 MAG: cell envelope integrity protein CreD [Bacteroidota bacterium]REK47825.1 MAG: cell envelope integrity protein CreD [Bacteroidota bacterium]
MDNTGFFEKIGQWASRSVSLKLFTIGFLILLLLIPLAMVQDLIRERENTRDEAIREVSSKWGGRQTIGGPVISIPYKYSFRNEKGQIENGIRHAHFLPDELKINGIVYPEKRYRGIYIIMLYKADLKIEGKFGALNFNNLSVPKEDYLFDDAVLSLGISDNKGINDNVELQGNNLSERFGPGLPCNDIFESGISLPVSADTVDFAFSISLSLNGSTELNFLPFGKVTHVHMESSWPDVKFHGSSLPDSHDIRSTGFTADWKVLELNRNYPQQGTGNFIPGGRGEYESFESGTNDASAIGMKLLLPVDEYQKNMRSAKYGIMFIIITFLSFFFMEILTRRRIHPFQYLLVGFAVSLFYILLLSISEHLNFNKAYLLSCLSILLMITSYTAAVFKSRKYAMIMFGILALLYMFFYSLLQLQDYALLMGSIGLLVMLAVIMYMTRNIDWYRSNDLKNS